MNSQFVRLVYFGSLVFSVDLMSMQNYTPLFPSAEASRGAPASPGIARTIYSSPLHQRPPLSSASSTSSTVTSGVLGIAKMQVISPFPSSCSPIKPGGSSIKFPSSSTAVRTGPRIDDASDLSIYSNSLTDSSSFLSAIKSEAGNLSGPIEINSSSSTSAQLLGSWLTSPGTDSSMNASSSLDSSTSLVAANSSATTSRSSSYISVNDSLIKRMKKVIEKGNKITSKDVESVRTGLGSLQDTPGKSAECCVTQVATNLCDSLMKSPTVDQRRNFKRTLLNDTHPQDVQENDQMLQTFRSVPGNKSKERRLDIVAMAASKVEGPLQNKFKVVDTQHCMEPTFKRKKDGTIVQVSGGHNESSYSPSILDRAYFQSNDPEIKGISIAGVDVKSVQTRLDHAKFLKIKNESRLIAKSLDNSLQILQAPDGRFYGSHPNLSNPLIINSLFPLVVAIKDSAASPSQPVKVGTIKKMSPKKTKLEKEYSITLSPKTWTNMITKGSQLSPVEGASVNIVNITEPLSRHCAKDIKAAELIKLPPVFAVVSKS